MADIPSPVSNRQTNVVQARGSDVREVLFSDPLPFINAQVREANTERSGKRGEGGRYNYVSSRVIVMLKQAGGAYSVPVMLKRSLGDRT